MVATVATVDSPAPWEVVVEETTVMVRAMASQDS